MKVLEDVEVGDFDMRIYVIQLVFKYPSIRIIFSYNYLLSRFVSTGKLHFVTHYEDVLKL